MAIGDPVVPDNRNGMPGRHATRVSVIADARAEHQPEIHTLRGPLLAVCGLCGGAGASTLAYLVALAEASGGCRSVLLCDTGGPSGGVAWYAGVESPRSLVEAAEHVAAGLPTGQLVAIARDGLRVLATGPRFTPECARAGVELLLDHARARYELTVIDCGTLAREADHVALERASHVAWVLPATVGGIRRARRVLEAINPYLLGAELIVARHDDRARNAPLSELRRVAERRRATLVLLPTLPDLATSDVTEALGIAQVSLQAIQGALAR